MKQYRPFLIDLGFGLLIFAGLLLIWNSPSIARLAYEIRLDREGAIALSPDLAGWSAVAGLRAQVVGALFYGTGVAYFFRKFSGKGKDDG